MARRRFPRVLIAVTLVVGLLLTACAPVRTTERYAAGDGARGDLGTQLHLENILVLTEAGGSPGTFLAGIANTGEATTVTISVPELAEGIQIELEPRSTLLIHPEHHSIVLPSVPVPPGAMLTVQFSTPETGSITIPVPVLDGTINPYQEYLPGEDA